MAPACLQVISIHCAVRRWFRPLCLQKVCWRPWDTLLRHHAGGSKVAMANVECKVRWSRGEFRDQADALLGQLSQDRCGQ
jgi:hypothetical protein